MLKHKLFLPNLTLHTSKETSVMSESAAQREEIMCWRCDSSGRRAALDPLPVFLLRPSQFAGRQIHDPARATGREGGRGRDSQPRTCKSWVFFLVMVDVATWRLEIRWEQGFFFFFVLLTGLKRGRDGGRERWERKRRMRGDREHGLEEEEAWSDRFRVGGGGAGGTESEAELERGARHRACLSCSVSEDLAERVDSHAFRSAWIRFHTLLLLPLF